LDHIVETKEPENPTLNSVSGIISGAFLKLTDFDSQKMKIKEKRKYTFN